MVIMKEKRVLYNITFKIDKHIESQWLTWMREVHIPEMMGTQCFIQSKMNKMLFIDEEDGVTYTIQYLCDNLKALQKFHATHANLFFEIHDNKFKSHYVSFQSVMEICEEF